MIQAPSIGSPLPHTRDRSCIDTFIYCSTLFHRGKALLQSARVAVSAAGAVRRALTRLPTVTTARMAQNTPVTASENRKFAMVLPEAITARSGEW